MTYRPQLHVHSGNEFPSLALYRFSSGYEFNEYYRKPGMDEIISRIDDRFCTTRYATDIDAFCSICNKPSKMRICYNSIKNGTAFPWWTEVLTCSLCGFNSRTRALDLLLKTSLNPEHSSRCYIAEQATKWAEYIKSFFPNATFSEYVSSEAVPGSTFLISYESNSLNVRHEDLTALSFLDNDLTCVVTRDVFEHIPDYKAAFQEIYRCLRPSGCLIFSIPFNGALPKTVIRARIVSGSIEHILPPEIHGNPVSNDGSLCFQNFGWDILDELRDTGFQDASSYLYWSPVHGHIGSPCFIFKATK